MTAFSTAEEAKSVAAPFAQSTPSWYAVYTSARHEKSVAARLTNRGVSCFLPLFEAEHKWGGRRVTVQLPLFANYLFAQIGAPRDRLHILESPGVVYIVGTRMAPSTIPDEEIAGLRAAISTGLRLRPHSNLPVGQRVRISRGPFHGREGLLARSNEVRVVVSIEAIRQSFSVEVSVTDIQPVF